MKITKKSSWKDSKPCKLCGTPGHTKTFCFMNKKTPIKQSTKPLKRTPIKARGKKASKWSIARKHYLKHNPADKDGNRICGICKKPVHESEITIDHILPRTRRPDLIFTQSNLQPAHAKCNESKASTVDDEFDSYGKVQRRRQTEAWLFVMNTPDLNDRRENVSGLIANATDETILRDLHTELEFIDKLLKERLQ